MQVPYCALALPTSALDEQKKQDEERRPLLDGDATTSYHLDTAALAATVAPADSTYGTMSAARFGQRRDVFPVHVSIGEHQQSSASTEPLAGSSSSPGSRSVNSAHFAVISQNDEELQLWAYERSMWKMVGS